MDFFKIIGCIVGLAAFVGIVSFVIDLFSTPAHKPYGPYEKFFKRPLDAFFSTGALIILSPIMLITALLVRMKLGSPVLFSQDRPGRNEKVFRLYKFRTMTNERDEEGNLLPDDVRLTPFGQKLRNTSIDELPELLNIIKGNMAIVGPRPLLVKYLPWYTDEQQKRHDVRPGLTGFAQANGRNAVTWDDKFAMDVEYCKHITFAGDLKIILSTIKSVLKHEGISSATSATMEGFDDFCKSVGRSPRQWNRNNHEETTHKRHSSHLHD